MNSADVHKTADNRYSILCISDKYFGVEIDSVREVIQMPQITRVPNVHESILGIFNRLGTIYSIVDLRKLFGMETASESETATDKSYIVIIKLKNFEVGVVVDKVLDVIKIDMEKIQIPSREMPPQFVNYLNGYVDVEKGKRIYLLDTDALGTANEISKYRL